MAIQAALLIITLRVWDLLLLKEHLDRPGVVAAWLIAAFVLVPSGLLRAHRLGDVGTWMRLVGAGILAVVLLLPGLMPMVELLRAGARQFSQW